MQPTLRDGDVLLARMGDRPAPGDIAVVVLPQRDFIAVKRVTRHDDDGWWVERDNPREGVDSWSVGAVDDDGLIAVVRARLWPLRAIRRFGSSQR